jgi:hypothetical protein
VVLHDHKKIAAKRGPVEEEVPVVALNGRKLWGAWARICRTCSRGFLSRRSNAAYCSPECRKAGLARIKRVWSRVYYMRDEMDPRRLAEMLEAVGRFSGSPNLRPIGLARRTMAHA